MNFASFPFVLIFLPVTLALFHLIRGPRAGELRMVFLTLASGAFYLSSGWQNGLVLGSSIAANYFAARAMLACDGDRRIWRKRIMWLAVLANVGLLLVFKISILGAEGPDGFNAGERILLPLALSFVTFQQIGFVVAIQRGKLREFTLSRYLFFVLFYPQMILGPIVRYEDVSAQLDANALGKVDPKWVATGMAVFCFALAKKLVIANGLGTGVDDVFETAQWGNVSLAEAWFGITTFQLQLFFDFSAYAEMSIGLAMMHGIRIPLNFDRPLFARDRADVWRRWNISFSTFMRGNVFVPLVRAWKWPVWLALALTGILSGLWHGLGLTFVLWGLIQTAILLYLHLRTGRRRKSGRERLPVPLAIAATFLTTCLIGALFRAPDIETARHVYASLAGAGGLGGIGYGLIEPRMLVLALVAAALGWVGPDFGQFFRKYWQYTELRPGAEPPPKHWTEDYLAFRPVAVWGLATAMALVIALIFLLRHGEAARFVYAQF